MSERLNSKEKRNQLIWSLLLGGFILGLVGLIPEGLEV